MSACEQNHEYHAKKQNYADTFHATESVLPVSKESFDAASH